MKILYITDNLASSSVFRSQVHTICESHSQNHEVKLLAFCKPIDMGYKSNCGYELIKVRRPPLFSTSVVSHLQTLFFTNRKLFEWADVIHCRGHGPSLMAINILKKFGIKKPIISDVRGALVDEISESSDSYIHKFIATMIYKAERKIFSKADHFFFVSSNMKAHFLNKYSVDKECNVFPTVVNHSIFKSMPEARKAIRKELKIDDNFVYVYSGGASYWQNLDNILSAYKDAKLKHPSIFLLILTPEKEQVVKLVEEARIPKDDYTILSLNYEDVGKYLNAADAGLIIRSDSIVNHVASPTKVNEYISCGLKVVDDLNQFGNQSYTASNWVDNYMVLEQVLAEQSAVYQKLAVK
ncbi:glycosyltransferase [uncultured Photobacterium sp.]|uniref:glycosyltransferase n=1 Tax=uncultured Photobacterium sp. TaxID=173973 RepID=UPI002615A2C2|nr:glycosyltransferase [uncultured Photobacterium sp.]